MADCNHDGVIDNNDVDLLAQAGLLLEEVNQNKTYSELQTDSEYVKYLNLISQNCNNDTVTETEKTITLFDKILNFVSDIFVVVLNFIRTIFA